MHVCILTALVFMVGLASLRIVKILVPESRLATLASLRTVTTLQRLELAER